MPTKRIPTARTVTLRITAKAVSLFEQMRRLERACRCPPTDWSGEYWKQTQCTACEKWWQLHSELHDELGCRPWHWPCIENPHAESPYPPGSAADLAWKPNRRGQALWKALAHAAYEAVLARRKALKARRAAAMPPPPPPLPASDGPPGPEAGA